MTHHFLVEAWASDAPVKMSCRQLWPFINLGAGIPANIRDGAWSFHITSWFGWAPDVPVKMSRGHPWPLHLFCAGVECTIKMGRGHLAPFLGSCAGIQNTGRNGARASHSVWGFQNIVVKPALQTVCSGFVVLFFATFFFHDCCLVWFQYFIYFNFLFPLVTFPTLLSPL